MMKASTSGNSDISKNFGNFLIKFSLLDQLLSNNLMYSGTYLLNFLKLLRMMVYNYRIFIEDDFIQKTVIRSIYDK